MALVNPNIALGVQPIQFESPMKMALAANQLRESQLKAQEYEAAGEERNRLRALNPNDPDYVNQLMRVSPTQGIAYQKSLQERESAKATTSKSLAEAAAARQKMTGQALRDISSRPSDANITAHLEDVLESNLYDPTEKAAVQKRTDMLLQMPFEERKLFLANQGATVTELRPQVVAPGSSLVQGGKAIYTAPAAPAAPTNLAKLQGEMAALPPGDPRRAQYEALIRKETTHAPAVSITNVAEKAEAGEFGKMLVGQYSDISKAAGLAVRTLPSIEANLGALNKGLDTGFGTDAKAAGARVLGALGVKDAEKFATDTQTFQSNAISAVLQKQLEQKGPQTESDARRIEQVGAELGKTKAANEFILSTAKEQLRRDIEQRNFYDKWKNQTGSFNGAEAAWFAGEGSKSLFDRPALKKFATGIASEGAASQIPTAATPARAVAPAPAPSVNIDALLNKYKVK